MNATRRRANAISRRLPNSNHKKVLVALSGGVDSAVAAAILKKQGFDVVGVFFDFGPWSDVSKAKKIAEKIKIPLKIINARKVFKKKIIDYFVAAYKSGITPNPCVVCNREIKFRLLFDLLKKYRADCAATGHYARNDNFKLREARDKSKDQSYFLYRLTQKELAKIIFPLGEYRKTETKKMAKKFGLPVVGEEESQDVCFLLGKDINVFLKKYIKPKPGNIVDEQGSVLGKHKGLALYTIGQRRGIEIGGTGPYFVAGKNGRKNELIVSNDPKKLLTKKFWVSQANWVNGRIKFPLKAEVQARYHGERNSAIIRKDKSGKLAVEMKKTLRAPASGQSAVFYKDDEVLGGGVISQMN